MSTLVGPNTPMSTASNANADDAFDAVPGSTFVRASVCVGQSARASRNCVFFVKTFVTGCLHTKCIDPRDSQRERTVVPLSDDERSISVSRYCSMSPSMLVYCGRPANNRFVRFSDELETGSDSIDMNLAFDFECGESAVDHLRTKPLRQNNKNNKNLKFENACAYCDYGGNELCGAHWADDVGVEMQRDRRRRDVHVESQPVSSPKVSCVLVSVVR